MRALCFGVLIASAALGVGLACGAPSSFDHLVGGSARGDGAEGGPGDDDVALTPDDSLPMPRPVAPLSATFVNGLRPRFRWELPAPLSGARLELCRSPACDVDIKTFDGDTEATPTEDLEAGFWFWRLRGKTATSIGKPSPTVWEVLVRGGGSSAIANGTVVDVDRDGKPDIVATLRFTFSGPTPAYEILPFFGSGPDGTSFRQTDSTGIPVAGPTVSVPNPGLAVSDTDGDGFGDITIADTFNGKTVVVSYFGSADGLRDTPVTLATPAIAELPLLAEGPELDGDGYGDVLVSSPLTLLQYYGSPRGLGPVTYLFVGYDAPDGGFPKHPLPIGAGFDRDGNGLFDVAVSWPIVAGEGPLIVFPGAGRRQQEPIALFNDDAGANPSPPTRFASGDVDGDGKSDIAFVSDVGGRTSVCVFLGATRLGGQPSCFSPDAPAAGFGSSLGSGDIEGDGKDEVLVGATSGGVDVLRWAGGGAGLAATHLDTPFGASLVVVHPGRPGPAVWAATRADGSGLAIFKGTAQANTVPAPGSDPNFPADPTTFADGLR